MNIRIPSSFEAMPDAVTEFPDRVRRGYGRISVRTKLILGIVGALLIALILYSIFGGSAPKPPPPAPVVVQRATRATLSVVEHTIGTVVSNATVQVTARVQGELMKAYFTEGQTVHKGDPLFQIDPRPYQAALNNATASLATAKVKAQRYAALLAQKAVAPQDADDAKAAYLEAQANVDAARLNLDYTQIRSPIDGKTGPILIQPGNQITASGSVGAGVSTTGTTTNNALVTITQMTPIKISFALPQADLPRIQKRMATQGMAVSLMQQGATDNKPLTATVDFVGNQVNDATGTIELRATFASQQSTLVPGQLVDVSVVLDAVKDATVVPHDAINLGPTTNFVYLVKQGKAQMVPVTVTQDDGTTAAIQGKVRPGDIVIVDGQLKVAPGKPVRIAGQPHAKK